MKILRLLVSQVKASIRGFLARGFFGDVQKVMPASLLAPVLSVDTAPSLGPIKIHHLRRIFETCDSPRGKLTKKLLAGTP
jgi:hypothetical protein